MTTGIQWTERTRPHDAPWYWTAAFAIAFFAAIFRFGTPLADVGVDESWAAVLGWARLHELRWGVDLIFTYGPLGFLQPKAPYEPELFDEFLAGQALVGIGYAFLYAQCFRRLGVVARLVFAAVALLACRAWPDALMLGAAIVAIVAIDDGVDRVPDRRIAWSALAVVALQLHVVGFIKFSVLPLAVAAAGVGALLFLRDRRYAAATAWLLLCAVSALVAWSFGGQSIGDLPAYLHTSVVMAATYGASMGTDSTPFELALGVTVLAACVAALVVWWRGEPASRGRALIVAAYLAFSLYVTWRAAFTRADAWHTRFFFPLACFWLFTLLALRRRQGRASPAFALGALAAIGVAATAVSTGRWLIERAHSEQSAFAHVAPSSGSRREMLDARRLALKRELDLPTMRRLVGNERVDMFGCSQGLVLLNEFTYAPRPIFQTYAAHTNALQRMNEAYYLGSNAPPFVILGLCAIDGRVPTGDDSLALLALLRAYQPAAFEKGFVLMRRKRGAEVPPIADAQCPCAALRRGEWIDVPRGDGTPVLMHLRYELTPLGRLRAALLREPVLILEAQAANGETTGYRLVRDNARTGFLVSPMFGSEGEYLNWYFNRQWAPIARVRVVAEHGEQDAMFASPMSVGFTSVPIPDGAASQASNGRVGR